MKFDYSKDLHGPIEFLKMELKDTRGLTEAEVYYLTRLVETMEYIEKLKYELKVYKMVHEIKEDIANGTKT